LIFKILSLAIKLVSNPSATDDTVPNMDEAMKRRSEYFKADF